MTKKPIVIHRPGGYEAYKDQTPIRKPNWKVILGMISSIFVCGMVCASTFLFWQFFNKPQNNEPSRIESILQPQAIINPAFNVIVSSPQPTLTAIPSALPTQSSTDSDPTSDNFLMTVEFMATQMSAIQTQTAQPIITEVVITATSSAIPSPQYESVARVVYNNVIVRNGSTTNSTALTMVYNGETFGVLETVQGWVRVDHPEYETAWIARHLLRIENE